MDHLRLLLIISHVFTFVCGKHILLKDESKQIAYPRQMIIPNKFIPMLKESALFKSRSSSNDLSEFLKPKSHETVTGKTRQNLMSAIGMDGGPSQEEGGMGPGGMGQGGMGPGGMGQGGMGPGGMGPGGMGEGLPGMAAMSGGEGMGMAGGMGGGGGLEGLDKMGGGMDSMGGMNDPMNAMNGMGGMPNSERGGNSLEGQFGGNNAMNNGGPEGMMSNSNNVPAGDPLGTLKTMLDNQGTNAALGTGSEAFGPGGSANPNVLAMLNQIVGKEMPGDSPVDPSSKSQQVWDQIQKGLSNQNAAAQPYIDSQESKHPPEPAVQNDAPPTSANNPAASASPGPKNETTPAIKSPVYNLTLLAKSSHGSSQPKPIGDTVSNAPIRNPNTPDSTSTKSNANIHSQSESHETGMTKTTSNPAEIDVDDDQPLPDDMVKFLKGIKFVVSQQPGNDIILGKKFTSDVPLASTHLKEENGVMKNLVYEKHKQRKGENKFISINNEKKLEADEMAVVKDLKGIDLSYARNLLRRNVNSEEFTEYKKAAKVLERASRKLKDPIAKKSTEIAIASILQVLTFQNKKKTTPGPAVDLLTGGDVKNALSEKYFEAARVLGTASKKLADPVAKKSAEIGIASILKVIALDNYSMSKKDLVPSGYYRNDVTENYFNIPGLNRKRNLIAADEVAHKLTIASKLESN